MAYCIALNQHNKKVSYSLAHMLSPCVSSCLLYFCPPFFFHHSRWPPSSTLALLLVFFSSYCYQGLAHWELMGWWGFYNVVRLLLCNLTCCEMTIVFILQYINTTKNRRLDSAIKVAKLHNRLNILVFWVVSLYKEKSK